MIMTIPFIRLKNQPATPIPIRIEYDARRQVIARFLNAVKANPDDAWAFVSRICSSKIDLDEIRELMGADVQHVKFATYATSQKKWKTHSMYITDTKRKVRKLLHLRMVKEPDHNGKWKIFGVEQEECTFK